MATVTDATIRTTLWDNIFAALDGLTYGSSTEPVVLRSYSDLDDDETFPRVIIHPVGVNTEKDGFGRQNYNRTIRIIIDVWSTSNADLDIITDKVANDFETRNYVGVNFVGVVEAITVETGVNQKFHLNTLTVTFMRG